MKVMENARKNVEKIRNPSISSPYSFSYYRGGGCKYLEAKIQFELRGCILTLKL